MKKIILIFMLVLFPQIIFAAPDLELEALLRTFPMGGGVTAKAGLGVPIWGSAETEGEFLYGYVRPELTAVYAGDYSSHQMSLQIFPVSFLGLAAGTFASEMNDDYDDFDCNLVQCEGRIESEFVEAYIALGYGQVFFAGQYRQDEIAHEEEVFPFVDSFSGLTGAADGDKLIRMRSILGWKLNEKFVLALTAYTWEMEEAKIDSRMMTLNLSYKLENWRFVLGGGTYESDIKPEKGTVIGLIKYTLFPKIGFF